MFPEFMVVKFQDPTTGLFWSGNLRARGEHFTNRGIEFRTTKTATEAWHRYEVTRARFPDMGLPEVERVMYRVELHELERINPPFDDKLLRETQFNIIHGSHSHLCGFVRQLAHRGDFLDFTHIIERHSEGELNLAALKEPVASGKKNKKRFIAVRSAGDLMFARMSLGDKFKTAYDMVTGQATA